MQKTDAEGRRTTGAEIRLMEGYMLNVVTDLAAPTRDGRKHGHEQKQNTCLMLLLTSLRPHGMHASTAGSGPSPVRARAEPAPCAHVLQDL